MMRVSTERPKPEFLHRQAIHLLDELKVSEEARALPVVSVDDGLFAIAALIDEMAMAMPDLRGYWGQAPIQALRWVTTNAGVEFFQRLERARQGPRNVLATFMVVLGLGYRGQYGLPGADPQSLEDLRRALMLELGIDPDRDASMGMLIASRLDAIAQAKPEVKWYRSLWFFRVVVIVVGVLAAIGLGWVLLESRT